MGCCNGKLHGLLGAAQSIIGLGLATESVIAARRDICRVCAESVKKKKYLNHACQGLTTTSICKLCKCNIALKTRLAGESCPDGKWQSCKSPD